MHRLFSLKYINQYNIYICVIPNCLDNHCSSVNIGHTHLTLSYILKNDPPPQCEHCQCILTVSHILVEGRKEMFYLTTHSTHFIYGYMASDIWLRTIPIVRKETRCRHIGYSFRLTARVLLYAPSHRQDSTYHGLCYTSRGALAGTRNSSMGSFWWSFILPHKGNIYLVEKMWWNH